MTVFVQKATPSNSLSKNSSTLEVNDSISLAEDDEITRQRLHQDASRLFNTKVDKFDLLQLPANGTGTPPSFNS